MRRFPDGRNCATLILNERIIANALTEAGLVLRSRHRASFPAALE
jgi:hypothetical protein